MARLAPMIVPPLGARVLAARGRLLGPERLVDSTLDWTMCDPTRLDPALRRRLVELATTRRRFPEAPAAYADSARALFWYLTRGMPRRRGAGHVPDADRARRPRPAGARRPRRERSRRADPSSRSR